MTSIIPNFPCPPLIKALSGFDPIMNKFIVAQGVINNKPVIVKLLHQYSLQTHEFEILTKLQTISDTLPKPISKVYLDPELVIKNSNHQDIYIHTYIVLEYIEGTLLQDKLNNGLDIRPYLIDILEQLRILHQHGIVHNDIKANNIVIKPNDHAALIDFGEAFTLDGTYPQSPINLLYPNCDRSSRRTTQTDIDRLMFLAFINDRHDFELDKMRELFFEHKYPPTGIPYKGLSIDQAIEFLRKDKTS